MVETSNTSKLAGQLNDLNEEIEKAEIQSKDNQKKEIMELLHEYNDIKDATQIVLSALANYEGTTIKEMHLKYNLPLES